MNNQTKKRKVILDYDSSDSSSLIDKKKKLKFEDVGLELPPVPPTQVISIRLPTELINEIKALGSKNDVPYQALIKILLADGIRQKKSKTKKSA